MRQSVIERRSDAHDRARYRLRHARTQLVFRKRALHVAEDALAVAISRFDHARDEVQRAECYVSACARTCLALSDAQDAAFYRPCILPPRLGCEDPDAESDP